MGKSKSEIKNLKGITIISLVITVIVLIILAGVTLNILLGGNGIINKAKTARDENEKSTATETMNLKITNVQISKYTEEQRMPTLKELADNFCEDDDFQYVQETSKVASLTKITNNNPTSIYTKLKAYPYEFEINNKLQLASIDGVKLAGIPENDGDSIVEMTMSELQSTINSAIDNKLKDYSKTTDISSNYASKTEESEITLDDPSNWTVSFNKVIKTGNQCTIMFGGTYKNNFNKTSKTIGTLPYTPKYMITDSGAVSTIDIHQIKDMLYVYLNTAGKINVADWGATGGKTIVINTTYICQ